MPAEQDRLLASAIRDHRADTPIPPEPEPGRTTVQREPRLLVRQASTRLAGLHADLREAKRRRDEFAALVKKTGG